MRSFRSHLLVACAASTVTALVVGGIVYATIPNNMNGDITACYRTKAPNKGELRIIDHEAGRACRSNEAMLAWPSRGFSWRGTWQSGVAYKTNDVVSYNGSAYIATKPTTNVLPVSAGYWSLMASAGTPGGAAGATGATGATGVTGPSGATGASGVAECDGYPHAGIDWSVSGSTPGNGCDLAGANLANLNFNGANLTNANLSGANLDTVIFDNANLTGVNLAGAINMSTASVTGTIWSNTTCPDSTNSSTNGTSPESCVGHF